jgi:hypothetical protein
MLTLVTKTHTDVSQIVSQHFELRADGWFYPRQTGVALVRIMVDGLAGEYRIERRRKASTAWMPIVTAPVAEFDENAFAMWRDHWQLVAPSDTV